MLAPDQWIDGLRQRASRSTVVGTNRRGPASSDRGSGGVVLAVVGIALAIAALLGPLVVSGEFLGDDFGQVARFSAMEWGDLPRLVVADWSGGIWGMTLPELRPVLALTYMVDARVWGPAPMGFRLSNLLIHLIAGCLCGGLAWQLFACRRAAWIASALYLVHPVHAESLGWISGRSDSLAAATALASVVAFVRFRNTPSPRWLMATWSCYLLALYSKESAVVVPALGALVDLRGRVGRSATSSAREVWIPYLGWGVLFGGYLACRWIALGSAAWLPTRSLAAGLERAWGALLALFVPLGPAWPGAPSRWLAIAALCLFLALAVDRLGSFRPSDATRRHRYAWPFAFSWCLLAILPALMANYTADRHVVLAAAGPALGFAWTIVREMRPRRWAALVAILLLAWSAVLAWRLEAWSRNSAVARSVRASVVEAVRRTAPGAPMVLDLPSVAADGTYVWSYAAPFALRPPFMPEPVDADRLVLTAPGVDSFPETWHRRVAEFRRSLRTGVDATLLSVDANGRDSIRRVPYEELERALGHLTRGLEEQHRDTAWRRFVQGFE